MNARDVHDVMVSKGFWTNEIFDIQARTWRQLCHIADELYEVDMAQRSGGDPIEELADVCIVILDLLGAHGFYDICPGDLMELSDEPVLALVMRDYRKTNRLNVNILLDVMSWCAFQAGGVEYLSDAIDAKMEVNARRNFLYGVSRG